MINNIVLVGRTTKNIELKQSKNGTSYVTFSIAVNRSLKDEQGHQQTDFINCIAWNKIAETVAQYVFKGMMIGIEGRLQVRSYENEAGVLQSVSEVLVHRVTFLESKKSEVVGKLIHPHDSPNYDNLFATATTLAGQLTTHQNTMLIDEELAF